MKTRIRFYVESIPGAGGLWSASTVLRAETQVLALVHAAVPALRSMALFQTEAGLVLEEDEIAVEVSLAAAEQLPLLADASSARRMSERKLNLSALAELRSVHSSILATQGSVDQFAAKLRGLRAEVLQSLQREELALLELVRRAAGRQMKFTLPAHQETLCFPSFGGQVTQCDVVRLRVLLKKIGDEEAFSERVELRGADGAFAALLMGTQGAFRLRPQATRFSPAERKLLAAAYGTGSKVEMSASLIRSTNGLHVMGAVVRQISPSDYSAVDVGL